MRQRFPALGFILGTVILQPKQMIPMLLRTRFVNCRSLVGKVAITNCIKQGLLPILGQKIKFSSMRVTPNIVTFLSGTRGDDRHVARTTLACQVGLGFCFAKHAHLSSTSSTSADPSLMVPVCACVAARTPSSKHLWQLQLCLFMKVVLPLVLRCVSSLSGRSYAASEGTKSGNCSSQFIMLRGTTTGQCFFPEIDTLKGRLWFLCCL